MSKIIMFLHKIIFTMRVAGIPLIPKLINKIFIRMLFGCQIGERTKFGKNVILGYGGLGVVIHDRAIIGNNVNIGSCVTIGGTSRKYNVPIIGDNTIIATGAKVLGPITIGKNCVIGANAVVLSDIPDNSLAAGVPARVIKSSINITDYRKIT